MTPTQLGLPRDEWEHQWTTRDPEAAGRILDEAGLVMGTDGFRVDAEGKRLQYDLLVVSGWSDWVRAAQITASGLRSIGVDVSVRTYDFGAWFNALQKGPWRSPGLSRAQLPSTSTTFLMDPETLKPRGEASAGNWHRYGEPGIAPIFEV